MEDDRAYFEQRAEAELEAAQQANDPAAARVHFELLGRYLDRVFGSNDNAA